MAWLNQARANTLRLAVTLLTVAALLWWVGPRQIVAAFANVVWFWVIVRIVPYAMSLWIQARRWQMFLQLEGISTDTNRLFRRIWMSRFFGQFSPGAIGGDLFRVIESRDFSDSRTAVARSVLLDRLVAVVSLGVYTSLACLLAARWSLWPRLSELAVIGLVAAISALLMLASATPGRLLRGFAQRLRAGRFRSFLEQLADSLADLGRRPGLLLRAALITIVFNLTWAISSECGFLALNQTISPLLVVTMLPVIYAATSLPVSINGIGVAEGVFVLAFTAAGVASADAAAVAILLRVTGSLMTGVGGVLFVLERRRLRRALIHPG